MNWNYAGFDIGSCSLRIVLSSMIWKMYTVVVFKDVLSKKFFLFLYSYFFQIMKLSTILKTTLALMSSKLSVHFCVVSI